MELKLLIIFSVLIIDVFCLTDDYLIENHEKCKYSHNPGTCFKYRLIKFISTTAKGDLNLNGNIGALKLVKLNANGSNETEHLFSREARQLQTDGELMKFFKFLKRQFDVFVNRHGVQLPLPEGEIQVVEENEIGTGRSHDSSAENEYTKHKEARGKKKQLKVLFPLLVLAKLFKIKILLAITLAGVLFIKKAIIIAAMILPNLLNMLKICKHPPVHHWAPETTVEYSTGYGGGFGGHSGGGGYSSGHGGYGKEWAHDRAYAAHRH